MPRTSYGPVSDETYQRILDLAAEAQPRPAPEPECDEKDFQAAVEKEARRLGWKVYHTRDSRKSEAGYPDCVMLRGPREVVAELKVGKNRTTAAQDAWLEAYRDAGREVYLWYPRDWPEILEVLK